MSRVPSESCTYLFVHANARYKVLSLNQTYTSTGSPLHTRWNEQNGSVAKHKSSLVSTFCTVGVAVPFPGD